MVTSFTTSPDQQDISDRWANDSPMYGSHSTYKYPCYLNVNMNKIIVIVNMTKIIYINIQLPDYESVHLNGLNIRRAHQMGYAPMIKVLSNKTLMDQPT